jgi:predicted transcriptional regulator
VHYFVCAGYPAPRRIADRGLILRGLPAAWQSAEWSGGLGNHDDELASDSCYGHGHGYFEWVFPLGAQADLNSARRLKVLCEASSRRMDTPQTDDDTYPTTLQMTVSGVRMYEGVLKNHPHDSRGVLSYLRDARGAYGYLINARAEGELLREIASRSTGDEVRLRCAVPAEAPVRGGLTIYGACSGQYPICPTIIVEW